MHFKGKLIVLQWHYMWQSIKNRVCSIFVIERYFEYEILILFITCSKTIYIHTHIYTFFIIWYSDLCLCIFIDRFGRNSISKLKHIISSFIYVKKQYFTVIIEKFIELMVTMSNNYIHRTASFLYVMYILGK